MPLKSKTIIFFTISFLAIIAIMIRSSSTDILIASPPGVDVFINQIGYLPDQPKWVVSARQAEQFIVIDETTNREVIKVRLRGIGDKTSGKHIWRGEFTGVIQPGLYRIEVKGVGASYPFMIGKNVYNSLLSKEFQPIQNMLPQLNNYKPTSIGWSDAALLGLFDNARTEFSKPEIKAIASAKVIAIADKYLAASQGSGYRYSLSFGEFAWASNKEGLSRGIAMLLANQLRTKTEYYENALAQLDFILGLNPLSKCFITSIGFNPVTAPHHRFMAATGKTVPGLMVGGPNNKAESGAELKGKGPFSYLDGISSYSSNEPAIDYNAALIFITAAFASKP